MCGDHQCLNGHISGTHMEKEKKKTKKKPTFFALSTYLDQSHHHSPFFYLLPMRELKSKLLYCIVLLQINVHLQLLYHYGWVNS